MSIKLFKHKQTAYTIANDMLDKVGKAAVIHPTGTGKSMIAFKFVETHPDAQFLWLAPSTYIYHTQLENLQRMIGDSDTESLMEHVTFMTYSKLMHDEIKKLKHKIKTVNWQRDIMKSMEIWMFRWHTQ